MCGIVGFVARHPRAEVAQTLAAMLARVAHRGPDGEGTWIRESSLGTVALGHRRLSIIDREGGAQPFVSEGERTALTYNGEVYNYRALRSSLADRGRSFHTSSDTEVVLQHHDVHGPRGLADLHGMFAYAHWDVGSETLTLARDRAGIKPLYYALLPGGEGIAFASEMTALLAHPDVPRTLDRASVRDFFFSDYVQPPGTVVAGIRQLPPGTWLEYRAGGSTEPRRYWSLSEVAPAPPASETARVDTLSRLLTEAVSRQLVSDVPVGAFVSGGIDSSLVAALAQRTVERPLKTFSIAFRETDHDERSHARALAKFIGSEHVEQEVDESSLLDAFDAALGCLDTPLGDPSIVPTYLVSKLAQGHVKVVLGGDGADELWAGYPTYLAHRAGDAYARVPAVVRNSLVDPVVSRLPVSFRYQSLEWKAKRFALRFDEAALVRHLRWMSATDLGDLADAFPGTRNVPPGSFAAIEAVSSLAPGNQLLGLDFGTYLPGSVLTKVDRASMACGLEVRPPLLDDALVTFAFGLPFSDKLHHLTTKYLLKKAAARFLPASIIGRKKKGFSVPLAAWLRGPLEARVTRCLHDSPLWDSTLSRPVFARWAEEHATMRVDRSKPLFSLLVFDDWMRRTGVTGSS